MTRRLTLFLVLVGNLAAADAHCATVHVRVKDVRNAHGHVLVAICTKDDFLKPHCPWRGSTPAKPGEVDIDIAGLPPGIYAAQAFHDENDNGRLDRTLFGLPEEAMGFSRDAPMRMGPPRFDDAAFTVGTADQGIIFSLRYF